MPQQQWGTNDIPDQSGRVAIVTGANTGIGLEAARALAGKNARVILAVRDGGKGERAADSIRAGCPAADVAVRVLDLADLASVKSFADTILTEHSRLDLLINNAGIMMCPYAQTRDGFEIQFGTNHLDHFALTGHLLPLLRQTAGSRVVNVSSLAHRNGKLDFQDLNWRNRKYSTTQAYCDSKLANMLFTLELAQKLAGEHNNPLATAAHPGWTRTDLQRHSWLYRFLSPLLGQDTATGALPTLRAAIDSAAKPGDFFGPGKRKEMCGPPVRVEACERALDRDAARKLWMLSEELTGVRY